MNHGRTIMERSAHGDPIDKIPKRGLRLNNDDILFLSEEK